MIDTCVLFMFAVLARTRSSITKADSLIPACGKFKLYFCIITENNNTAAISETVYLIHKSICARITPFQHSGKD